MSNKASFYANMVTPPISDDTASETGVWEDNTEDNTSEEEDEDSVREM